MKGKIPNKTVCQEKGTANIVTFAANSLYQRIYTDTALPTEVICNILFLNTRAPVGSIGNYCTVYIVLCVLLADPLETLRLFCLNPLFSIKKFSSASGSKLGLKTGLLHLLFKLNHACCT